MEPYSAEKFMIIRYGCISNSAPDYWVAIQESISDENS